MKKNFNFFFIYLNVIYVNISHIIEIDFYYLFDDWFYHLIHNDILCGKTVQYIMVTESYLL